MSSIDDCGPAMQPLSTLLAADRLSKFSRFAAIESEESRFCCTIRLSLTANLQLFGAHPPASRQRKGRNRA
jgi:hypothetical protein